MWQSFSHYYMPRAVLSDISLYVDTAACYGQQRKYL